MKKKKTSGVARVAIVGLVASGAVASWYFTLGIPGSSKRIEVPAYKVSRVIDGDTFETEDKQLVRLMDVFAPELENCGGVEAKEVLEKLVLGKPVYFKVFYRDRYFRLDSYVYTADEFVNLALVRNGLAVYKQSGKNKPESDLLKEAGRDAKENKRGVFGQECTQTTNVNKPKCLIKGNKRAGTGDMFYHYPGCGQYNNTDVQLYLGDKWFCSEDEAQKAGFKKGPLCP